MQPLNENALLKAVKDLIAVPSTSQDQAALHKALDCIAAMIWEATPDITIERFEQNGVPSLLAYQGRKRPKQFHIILNGHLDVVPGKPEQYKAVVRDGKLYGRGVYDMKAACVALTTVFCKFVNKVPYSLGLQIVTDEENAGQNGTLHQIERGVRADFVICGESGRPTDSREIANETKGIAIAELGFRGTSAHSAYPWKGDNAILKAARFIHALHERYPNPATPDPGTTASVTAISADSGAHSKLPDYTTIKLVVRYVVGDANFSDKKQFSKFIATLDPCAEIITLSDFAPPAYTSPRSPLLLQLKRAAEEVEGTAFTFVRRHGVGDGRFYGAIGSEACEFGIAGEDAHGDNEYITLEAFRNYLMTMHAFLQSTYTKQEARRPAELARVG